MTISEVISILKQEIYYIKINLVLYIGLLCFFHFLCTINCDCSFELQTYFQAWKWMSLQFKSAVTI